MRSLRLPVVALAALLTGTLISPVLGATSILEAADGQTIYVPAGVTVTVIGGAMPTASPTAKPTPAPTATASPTATPAPVVTPSPTPTPTPSPTPSPAPVACPSTLQGAIDAAAVGSTLNLTCCTFTSGATVGKRLTLLGATISRPGAGAWSPALSVGADDVTIDRVTIRDGGAGVFVTGRDRLTVRRSSFLSLTGSSIAFWYGTSGADDLLVEGNVIRQTYKVSGTAGQAGVSPIISRSSTDGGPDNLRPVIRGNDIDQGSRTQNVGWFGIELFDTTGALLEGNRFRGGHALISLAKSNGATVRDNHFDMSGTTAEPKDGAYWGVEVADADDAYLTGNTFDGIVKTGTRFAVAMNTDPVRATVQWNRAKYVHGFVGLSGSGHLITDNRLVDVTYVTVYGDPSKSTITRNGSTYGP